MHHNSLLRGFLGAGFQALNCLLGVLRLRTMGQDLQIVPVLLASLTGAIELFQAQGKVVSGNGVVIFVIKGLAIAALGGGVVFFFFL